MTAPPSGKSPVAALLAGVEQMLSELTDDQWADLVARVRQPADDAGDTDTDDQAAPPVKKKPTAAAAAYPASWNPKAAK
ncbi:hypothetical protein ABLE92_24450 [Gordonia sp. VNQ95]|uniref:hypothetical protein n=1 Tax=Gordonia sp. VNQ95 TaxID=3156619 RepID=UPI0032B5045F